MDYIVVAFIGFAGGCVVTWLYGRKAVNDALSKAKEVADQVQNSQG